MGGGGSSSQLHCGLPASLTAQPSFPHLQPGLKDPCVPLPPAGRPGGKIRKEGGGRGRDPASLSLSHSLTQSRNASALFLAPPPHFPLFLSHARTHARTVTLQDLHAI